MSHKKFVNKTDAEFDQLKKDHTATGKNWVEITGFSTPAGERFLKLEISKGTIMLDVRDLAGLIESLQLAYSNITKGNN